MSTVLISVITRDGICAQTVRWLLDQPYPVDIVHSPYTIEHQRNWQAERFLERDEDYLFIVDNDTIPKAGTIEELIKHAQPGVIMVAPSWAFSTGGQQIVPMAYRYRESLYYPVTYTNGIVSVDAAGMSGALIPRQVFKDISRPWFHMPHDEIGKLVSTEDMFFWTKVRESGYRLKAHLGLVAEHLKLLHLSILPPLTPE